MHEGHRDRVRDKFIANGLSGLPQHEVLEHLLFYVIPQGDTNPTAHNLINEFGSIAGVFDADIEDLMKVKGIGKKAATFIKLIPAIMNYYFQNRWAPKMRLDTSITAGMYCASYLGNEKNEKFMMICLNVHKEVLNAKIIAEGDSVSALVSQRRAAEVALQANAVSVILCHNHPGGSLEPSQNDIMLTTNICATLEKVKVEVVDHIIVSGQNFASLSDMGLMPN